MNLKTIVFLMSVTICGACDEEVPSQPDAGPDVVNVVEDYDFYSTEVEPLDDSDEDSSIVEDHEQYGTEVEPL